MKNIITLILLFFVLSCGEKIEDAEFDFTTRFENSEGTETATYEEILYYYEQLADVHPSIRMYTMDQTDSGKPLHLVTFNPNRTFESEFSGDKDKVIILINNGIHPGESDGIDASMMLMRDLAEGKIPTPQNAIVAVIPVYNIGGALNRNSTSRTNQNGPKEYGFRGNARNFDLNRDFIKADTKNARAFIDLFRTVKPDLFIDTHVSNGADYQYTLTHLFTQHNKLGGVLGDYLHKSFMPRLEDSLAVNKWDITPYVNVFNSTPENGFTQFLDGPRYSTGFASLYNTLGMMIETHMLKPYKARVDGTYALLSDFIKIANSDARVIMELRKAQNSMYKEGSKYPIHWKLDSTQTTTINFKGYESRMEPSDITGAPRLVYDNAKPYSKDITYYNYYKATDTIIVPEYYIVPKAQWDVMNILIANKIQYETLRRDDTLTAEVYRIDNLETIGFPYEGHYLHYNTQIRKSTEPVVVRAGDYKITTDQDGVRYLLETLEPTAPDSFFNWNFFDTILQQKEGFSPYVWEDQAEAFLEANPEIKKSFEDKKKSDPNFARNWYAQLDWIHKQSPNYEEAHLRYPIIRVGG